MAEPIKQFDEPRWFVCHTKPRCEKKFSTLLAQEGFEHYLALVKSVRQYKDRDRRFDKPLFPGYVFTEIIPEKKARLYQQDLLVRAIWVEDQKVFLKQLSDVKAVVASGLEATLRPLLKKGTRVCVTTGPLRGVEGFVEDPATAKGVIIAMDVLRQGVLVPIAPEYLRVTE